MSPPFTFDPLLVFFIILVISLVILFSHVMWKDGNKIKKNII